VTPGESRLVARSLARAARPHRAAAGGNGVQANRRGRWRWTLVRGSVFDGVRRRTPTPHTAVYVSTLRTCTPASSPETDGDGPPSRNENSTRRFTGACARCTILRSLDRYTGIKKKEKKGGD